MKKLLKLQSIIMICLVALLLTGCNKWNRVDKIQSAAIIEMLSSKKLGVFDKKGTYRGTFENDQAGAADVLKLTKGIFKKKGGLKQAGENIKKAGKERQEKELETLNNANLFQRQIQKELQTSLGKTFELKKFRTVKSSSSRKINLKNNKKQVKKYLKKAKADGIISIEQRVGVIREDASFGLSSKFELVAQVIVRIADKKGYIGHKVVFIRTGISKTSSGSLPAFTKEDFAVLLEDTTSEINTEIELLKL